MIDCGPEFLNVDLGSPEARQDQGGAAMDQMAAVELRGDVDGQIELAQRGLRRLPVGYGRGKIAAHREKDLHFAADHCLQCRHDVVSRRARRLEAEAVLEALEEIRLGDLRDPHGSVALHVGMTANRTNAGAVAPHIAAQKRKVGDLLHVVRTTLVLGNAHAVDKDGALRLHVSAGGIFHVLARQAGLAFDIGPLRSLEIVDQRFDAGGVPANEIPVQDLRLLGGTGSLVRFDQDLHDPLEDGDVATDTHLEKLRADRRRRQRDHLNRALRRLEAFQRPLAERIERDDRGPSAGRVAQAGHHPRAVGARILAEDENAVGLVEILQQHGPLADAERLRQADAGRLVAHVRAVGKVVGAVLAHEELIEEGGFVRGPPGRIELRHVRIRQRLQLAADHVERIAPRHREIAVGFGVIGHRMGEPTDHFEIVIVPARELGDRMLGEEFGRAALRCRLPGNRLAAVLAKLE